MIIEQGQILTTHNLATLVYRVGITPARDWIALARASFDHASALARSLRNRPRPMAAIKDIAYAWRQMVFYASQPGVDPAAFAAGLRADASTLRPAVEGLVRVAKGGASEPLVGWSTERHWLDSRP